jgi:hypothetical protein
MPAPSNESVRVPLATSLERLADALKPAQLLLGKLVTALDSGKLTLDMYLELTDDDVMEAAFTPAMAVLQDLAEGLAQGPLSRIGLGLTKDAEAQLNQWESSNGAPETLADLAYRVRLAEERVSPAVMKQLVSDVRAAGQPDKPSAADLARAVKLKRRLLHLASLALVEGDALLSSDDED